MLTEWERTYKADPAVAALADRHYSRQKVGAKQFAPPGKTLVLRTPNGDAGWVSVEQRFVRHAWPDAWLCSFFRNESAHLASQLVLEAVMATVACWKAPPSGGFVTFVDEAKVQRSRTPGRCFRKVGFDPAGYTKGGLLVLRLAPDKFPPRLDYLPPADAYNEWRDAKDLRGYNRALL